MLGWGRGRTGLAVLRASLTEAPLGHSPWIRGSVLKVRSHLGSSFFSLIFPFFLLPSLLTLAPPGLPTAQHRPGTDHSTVPSFPKPTTCSHWLPNSRANVSLTGAWPLMSLIPVVSDGPLSIHQHRGEALARPGLGPHYLKKAKPGTLPPG